METYVTIYKYYGMNDISGDPDWRKISSRVIEKHSTYIPKFKEIAHERYGMELVNWVMGVTNLNRNHYRIDATPMNVPVNTQYNDYGGYVGAFMTVMKYITGTNINPAIYALTSGILIGQSFGVRAGNWLRTHNIRKKATLWHN